MTDTARPSLRIWPFMAAETLRTRPAAQAPGRTAAGTNCGRPCDGACHTQPQPQALPACAGTAAA